MIIKNLAVPVARPVSQEGWSTYRAVILAPVGSPPFLNNPNYFDNKKVAFCRLASSGEFFFRSITNKYTSKAIITKAVNHDAAINMLSAGLVDIAIVKDRVWDKHKEKYLKIAIVGSDPGENPDGTLILAKTASPDAIAKISSILLGLEKDTSDIGTQVKTALKITGFINTTEADFKSTLDLLKKAGVTESYDFQ
jgi:ABC-type phosphate/phosphonate transport system substrate-binding protein